MLLPTQWISGLTEWGGEVHHTGLQYQSGVFLSPSAYGAVTAFKLMPFANTLGSHHIYMRLHVHL